ncbi:MAG: hypothetical protein OFPI_38820 [Osedax symbiont Rs2]|nr:MAG: hypothetical protein OFPI_38820 [Osedax symbiont Rs2]
MCLTLLVDGAIAVFERVKQLNFEIVQAPELSFYPHRRLLLKDPAGVLVDVSSPDNAE